LHDELFTHLKAGLPAAELIAKTLHNIEALNHSFLTRISHAPGELLPKQLATGDFSQIYKICEKVRLKVLIEELNLVVHDLPLSGASGKGDAGRVNALVQQPDYPLAEGGILQDQVGVAITVEVCCARYMPSG
jgi:hypothetical protein